MIVAFDSFTYSATSLRTALRSTLSIMPFAIPRTSAARLRSMTCRVLFFIGRRPFLLTDLAYDGGPNLRYWRPESRSFDTKQNTHTATGPQRCAICNLYSYTKPQDAARKLAVKARNPVDSMLTTET
jgi:hypothetical protein